MNQRTHRKVIRKNWKLCGADVNGACGPGQGCGEIRNGGSESATEADTRRQLPTTRGLKLIYRATSVLNDSPLKFLV